MGYPCLNIFRTAKDAEHDVHLQSRQNFNFNQAARTLACIPRSRSTRYIRVGQKSASYERGTGHESNAAAMVSFHRGRVWLED